jgi:hypothetical protein
VSDEDLTASVAGLKSREQLIADCDVILLAKPLPEDLALSADPPVIDQNYIYENHRTVGLYPDEGARYVSLSNDGIQSAGVWASTNASSTNNAFRQQLVQLRRDPGRDRRTAQQRPQGQCSGDRRELVHSGAGGDVPGRHQARSAGRLELTEWPRMRAGPRGPDRRFEQLRPAVPRSGRPR